jgi:hypothetical protein
MKLSNETVEAVWTTAYIDDLPDSSFAYIEPGGNRDYKGKTVPRSLRHLPYKDANGTVDPSYLRTALVRVLQTNLSVADKATVKAKLCADVKVAKIQSNVCGTIEAQGCDCDQLNQQIVSLQIELMKTETENTKEKLIHENDSEEQQGKIRELTGEIRKFTELLRDHDKMESALSELSTKYYKTCKQLSIVLQYLKSEKKEAFTFEDSDKGMVAHVQTAELAIKHKR